jgi:predicted transglutaminase-like cysteine proteinase
MRQYSKILVLTAMIVPVFWASGSKAAFPGLPLAFNSEFDQIRFGAPVLPPIGHSRFCLRYPKDCEVQGIGIPDRAITLTPERWSELTSVDREVNRDIVPVVSIANGATENWLISPLFGDCKDYAVTKRHRLLALGWPSRALLLSEVVVPSGEHHLVLVVRTRHVDLVLDNLNANIRSVAMTYQQYRWVRVESPQDPKFWARVDMPGIVHTASLN